jgi:signal transduction histidine kinase
MVRVSHELKTPLFLISGGIEYLFNVLSDSLNSKTMDVLKSIERATGRLQDLIENLLTATKIDYKKFVLDKSIIDFTKVIRNCIKELNYLINERNLILSLELPDELRIELDKLRIHQVITNLLLNSVKNTPPNGKISISLRNKEDWAELRVKDSGIGITQQEKEKLFTRFGKIERQGEDFEYLNIQGSGLGLYLSKVIVNMHGGEIWVESEGRNKGSTFIINLPI